MMKKVGLIVASLAAVGVIFVGASTYACGDDAKHKTAANVSADGSSCCPHGSSNSKAMTGNSSCETTSAQTASAGGAKGYSCDSKAISTSGSACTMSKGATGAGHACCMNKIGAVKAGDMASCGQSSAKASYAANVYQVRDGHQYAVALGKTFEVTDDTPYYEVGRARYYFADKESLSKCSRKMASLTAELDQEAVSLATVEGNVTTDNDGGRYAICPVSNDKFMVTADSPARVMDGQKYYVCSENCAHGLVARPAVFTSQETVR